MFRFSLEAVLDYRMATEELRQREYKKALEKIRALEAAKNAVLEKIKMSQTDIREGMMTGMTYAYRLLHEAWIEWALKETDRIDGEVERERARRRCSRLPGRSLR